MSDSNKTKQMNSVNQQPSSESQDQRDPKQYSSLNAFLGNETADSVRRFAQKLAAVEDRLEQEYLEDCTDQDL